MKKLWGGRFQKTPEKWVDEFGASITFDQNLVKEDITGSLAHAAMLKKCGILTEEEEGAIRQGRRPSCKKQRKGRLNSLLIMKISI
nr:hypothetical protein P5644_14890 [Bacillus velezensis]